MQQIYQQQMQAQVNTTITNEEKKSSGSIEMPDVAALNLGNGDAEVQTESENATENDKSEKSDFGVSGETCDDGGDVEHQCSEECGFCSDEESELFWPMLLL